MAYYRSKQTKIDWSKVTPLLQQCQNLILVLPDLLRALHWGGRRGEERVHVSGKHLHSRMKLHLGEWSFACEQKHPLLAWVELWARICLPLMRVKLRTHSLAHLYNGLLLNRLWPGNGPQSGGWGPHLMTFIPPAKPSILPPICGALTLIALMLPLNRCLTPWI